jgi:peptidoglycan/LPS O-acetylase OafA/YrhL
VKQQDSAAGVAQQSAANPKANRYYRPELDALRFFAFISVFCFHRMDYVPTDPVRDVWLFRIGTVGAFGVPVFFLLSAFLITDLLFRERERTGRIHVQAFYVRRILRIWPLYFAAFFGLCLLNHFVAGVGTGDPFAWLAFTFFTGNWYIAHHGWIAGSIDPLWSISVEEQFYIVIPVLAACGGRRAVQLASYVLLGGAYLTALLYALHPTPGDSGEWVNSFFQFQFFCAGTLLAILLHGRLVRLAVPVRLAGFALAAACWFTAMIRFKVQSWNPQPTPAGSIAGWLLVLAGTVLCFVCTLGMPARLVPAWLSYLGRISYGLYIVHSLVFFAVFEKAAPYVARLFPSIHLAVQLRSSLGTLLVLALSIGLAHLSYRYFERPFLRLKERFTFVASRGSDSAPAPREIKLPFTWRTSWNVANFLPHRLPRQPLPFQAMPRRKLPGALPLQLARASTTNCAATACKAGRS